MKIEKYFDRKEGREKFRARFQLNNKEFTPHADSRKRLLEIIDEMRAQEHRARVQLPTKKADVLLSELINAKIKNLDLTKKDARRRKVVLTDFAEFFPVDYTLRELDTADIHRWLQTRVAESKLKPWSATRLLGYVSACLREAPLLLKECADYRPPKIKWPKVPKDGAGRVISAEERKLLLKALREPEPQIIAGQKNVPRREQPRDVFTRHELADMFEIALQTGMRWGEICRLEWRFFHERERRIHLPKEITKTGEARDVFLNDRGMEILIRRKEAAAAKWIFPNPSGTSYRKYYSKPLRTVAKRLGLDYGQEIEGGFTPHSTRHTAGTMLVRITDLKTAGSILGHSDRTMTMLYTHSSESHQRKAMALLEDELND